MNQERRKTITKAIALIDEAKSLIETAATEERDYYDNMPESLQGSEKGELADQTADQFYEALN
mgnify:CR=1 FL=1